LWAFIIVMFIVC